MWMLGFTLNIFSLVALVLCVGFVVDDAIVVIENIVRHIEQGMAPLQAALTGVREIGFTVVSITLRSAERRVGKGWARTGSSGWSPDHSKNKPTTPPTHT